MSLSPSCWFRSNPSWLLTSIWCTAQMVHIHTLLSVSQRSCTMLPALPPSYTICCSWFPTTIHKLLFPVPQNNKTPYDGRTQFKQNAYMVYLKHFTPKYQYIQNTSLTSLAYGQMVLLQGTISPVSLSSTKADPGKLATPNVPRTALVLLPP